MKPSIVAVLRGVKPREFLHCACRAELDALLLRAHSLRTQRTNQLTCEYLSQPVQSSAGYFNYLSNKIEWYLTKYSKIWVNLDVPL